MSHFTVLVVLPKEGLEKFEGANEHTGEDKWRNAYNHQWFHPQLEEAMSPYYEQHDRDSEYMERDIETNLLGTEVWRAFVSRDWEELARVHNERRDMIEKWERKATLYGGEEDKPRKQTESEIAVKLEPIDKLLSLIHI